MLGQLLYRDFCFFSGTFQAKLLTGNYMLHFQAKLLTGNYMLHFQAKLLTGNYMLNFQAKLLAGNYMDKTFSQKICSEF